MKILTLIIIVSFVFLFSFSGEEDYCRVNIAQYSIGDKIDTLSFNCKNYLDSSVLEYQNNFENGLKVYTWYNQIVHIIYKVNAKNEFDSIQNLFTSILNLLPEFNEGKTKSGLEFLGNEYYWYDTNSGDEISMMYSIDSIGNFSGVIFIDNEIFTKQIISIKEETMELIILEE